MKTTITSTKAPETTFNQFFQTVLPEGETLIESAYSKPAGTAFLVVEKKGKKRIEVLSVKKESGTDQITLTKVADVAEKMLAAPKKIATYIQEIEAMNAAKAEKATKTTPKTAKAPKAAKTPKVKTEPKVRAKVTFDRVKELTVEANTRIKAAYPELLPQGARINLRPAVSGGHPVSAFVDVYFDDNSKSTGGRPNRVGFVTDGNWDKWVARVKDGVSAALRAHTTRVTTIKADGLLLRVSQGKVTKASGDINTLIAELSKIVTPADPQK